MRLKPVSCLALVRQLKQTVKAKAGRVGGVQAGKDCLSPDHQAVRPLKIPKIHSGFDFPQGFKNQLRGIHHILLMEHFYRGVHVA